MIYFEPRDEFLSWLIKRAHGRAIVDLGCGEGWLLHRLLQLGYKQVLGIEINWPNPVELPQRFWDADYDFELPPHTVIRVDAQCSELITDPNCLFVIARPDHSGWVQTVIKRATSEILYISKPCNVNIDLEFEGCTYTQLDAPACLEEKAYLVSFRGSNETSGTCKLADVL